MGLRDQGFKGVFADNIIENLLITRSEVGEIAFMSL